MVVESQKQDVSDANSGISPEKQEREAKRARQEVYRLKKQVAFLAKHYSGSDIDVLPLSKDDPDQNWKCVIDPETNEPKALMYSWKDLITLSEAALMAKLQQEIAYLKHHDFEAEKNLLEVAKQEGKDASALLTTLNPLEKTRIANLAIGDSPMQQNNFRQLNSSKVQEIKKRIHMETLRTQVSDLVQLDWLREKLRLISDTEFQEIYQSLPEVTQKAFTEIQLASRDYQENKDSYKVFEDEILPLLDNLQQQDQQIQENNELIDMIEELPAEAQEKIKQLFNGFEPQAQEMGLNNRNKELSPSMDEQKEGNSEQVSPFYTIDPPIYGFYKKEIFDTFDPRTIRLKSLSTPEAFSDSAVQAKHLLSSVVPSGISPLPMLGGYAPVVSSLKNPELKILKDNKNCFFIQNNSRQRQPLNIQFGKAKLNNYGDTPTKSHTETVHSSPFFAKTAAKIKEAQKIENLGQRAIFLANYVSNELLWYSNNSSFNILYKQNPLTYFNKIEQYGEADCDVANNYFVALCRAAGIPARVMAGDQISGCTKEGKAMAHGGTGHAKAQVWTGNGWKSIDATPKRKKKEDPPQENQDNAPNVQAPEVGDDLETETSPEPSEENGTKGTPEDAASETKDQVSDVLDDKSDMTNQSQDMQDALQDIKDSLSDKEKEAIEKKAEENLKEKQKEESQQEASDLTRPDEDGKPKPNEADSEMAEGAKKDIEDFENKEKEDEAKKDELKDKIDEATHPDDIDDLLKDENLPEQFREELEQKAESKKEQLERERESKLDEMRENGFLEEGADKPTREDEALFDEYRRLEESIQGDLHEFILVLEEILPKKETIGYSDMHRRSGRTVDMKAVNDYGKRLTGNVIRAREIHESNDAKMMVGLLLDISRSMGGRKLEESLKTLLLFALGLEHFDIDLAIYVFDDKTEKVVEFGQEFSQDPRKKYELMKKLTSVSGSTVSYSGRGGTDMGKAIQEMNADLNKNKEEYPNYMSALFAISDGKTFGALKDDKLTRFMEGWGEYTGEGVKDRHLAMGLFLRGQPSAGSAGTPMEEYFGKRGEGTIVVDDYSEILKETSETLKAAIEKMSLQLGI